MPASEALSGVYNGSDMGAIFSRSSLPGSHSLLIVSTHPHESDGCVCAAKYLLLLMMAQRHT